MYKLSTSLFLALILLVSITGCDTLNVGTNRIGDSWPVIGPVTIVPATSFNAGETATITVTWASGMAPYTIAIDAGTAESVPAGTTATSPYTWDFTLAEGAVFNWTVTVTDARGTTGTATGTYGPVAGPLNEPPVIESVTVVANVLTVTVSDAEGDDVTVAVTDIDGLVVNQNVQTIIGGNGDAVFTWAAESPLAGGAGTTNITVYDEYCEDDPVTETANIDMGVIPSPAAGELWAVPLASTTVVDEPVTVVVVCGDFPTDEAFGYMNGVAVTVNDGGSFVAGTLNVGSIGGAQKDVDGLWANMNPAPTTFFIPEDFMMMPGDVVTDSSLDFMGFNITPIGGGELTTGGELFNFGMTFNAAGTYTLGFLEFQDVKRTYYSDGETTEYNWADIDNDNPYGSTVTVQ